jgi:hypothetical protein
MLAYDYPLLGLFWTMLWIFIWVAWIFLLIRVFGDIFRSHDMSGWAKALWSIFIIFLPFLGVLIYLIARGGSMQQRDIDVARQQEQAFRSYVQETAAAGGASTADELSKLADLRAKGVLSDAEFEAQKARLLA